MKNSSGKAKVEIIRMPFSHRN